MRFQKNTKLVAVPDPLYTSPLGDVLGWNVTDKNGFPIGNIRYKFNRQKDGPVGSVGMGYYPSCGGIATSLSNALRMFTE